jgi:hypothetical protein
MIPNFDPYRGDAPIAFGYQVGLVFHDQWRDGGVGAAFAGRRRSWGGGWI